MANTQQNQVSSEDGRRPLSFAARVMSTIAPELAQGGARADTLIESMQSVIPEFREFLTRAGDTTDVVGATAMQVQGFIGMIRTKIESIPSIADLSSRVADLLVLLYDFFNAFYHRTLSSVPTLIYRLVTLLGYTQELTPWAISKFSQLFRSNETNEGEEDEFIEAQKGAVSTLLSPLIGALCLGRQPTTYEVKDVNDRIRFFQNIKREVIRSYDRGKD